MRVFVSSTYRDLAEYRETLRLALETSGHSFHGMEHFGAQPDPPLATCLTELEHCDIYVALIGARYGSAPTRYRRSYTEVEYEKARELKMPCVILVLDEEAEVKQSIIEREGDARERLEGLKRRLRRNHTVETFRAPDDAAWKILAALRVIETAKREREEGGV